MFKFQIGPGLNNKWSREDKKVHYSMVCLHCISSISLHCICNSSSKQSQTSKATVKSTQSDESYEMSSIQVPGVYIEERTSRGIPELYGK